MRCTSAVTCLLIARAAAHCSHLTYPSQLACRQSFRAFKAIRPRLTLQFEGLGLELPDGRSILHDVTGRWEGGRQSAGGGGGVGV